MGIDIYAKWQGQTKAEWQAQSAAWLTTLAGNIGYLHEAYHGGQYATRFLFSEAFYAPKNIAPIRAAILRDRLPAALELVEQRERAIYHSDEPYIERAKQTFRDFVELCERKEKETGKPVMIVASH